MRRDNRQYQKNYYNNSYGQKRYDNYSYNNYQGNNNYYDNYGNNGYHRSNTNYNNSYKNYNKNYDKYNNNGYNNSNNSGYKRSATQLVEVEITEEKKNKKYDKNEIAEYVKQINEQIDDSELKDFCLKDKDTIKLSEKECGINDELMLIDISIAIKGPEEELAYLRHPNYISIIRRGNTLMEVYNQESIDDQQRVLDYTEKFINDRIEYLMNDIHEYEQVSVNFKRSHNIIDTKSYGQAYVAASAALTEEAKSLDAQADMVRYLLEFTKNNTNQIIPIGVVNVSAEASSIIKKYNDNLVKIEKYKADGTLNNPVAQNLMEEQVSLHASIVTVLETNLRGLEDRIVAANHDRNIAYSQIQSVPMAQLELGSVERMQGI